jgi:type II restriction/modification system DNA methylase subunit YeeA
VLIDRSKWHQKRLMRFNLADIFNRRETSTLQVMTVLLHHDHTCPAEGMALLETLDQNSHRHAFAVSEDLKYALREAVELLGNKAVWYLRHKAKDRILNRGLADQLTRECLRTMYRLLFLFYIEARPELGFAPMKSEAYRKGYSLEALRDRELARLTTPESLDGYHLHDSLARLFDLIYNGYPERGVQAQGDLEATPGFETFEIQPLKSHLFDPDRIPLLRTVRFRNHVLRRMLELMSLSREKPGKSRGRISYAQLGINQLGAVYEALLSYRGFFAEEDLYEVKKAGTDPDPLETAYFVPGPELEKYDDAEKVFEKDGSLRCYPRGTFIYRLAGRDREKSASYYTPQGRRMKRAGGI